MEWNILSMNRKQPKNIRMEDILNAAVSEFTDKGYEQTSMDSIAKKANLSKGGIYHHFKNKDELFLYANQKLAEPVYELAKKAYEFNYAAEALEFYIKNYILFWQGHIAELAFFFLSMSKSISNTALCDLYKGQTRDYIGFFEGLYRRGIDNNEFYEHNTSLSALSLMSLLDGMIGYIYLLDMEATEELINFIISQNVTNYKMKKVG